MTGFEGDGRDGANAPFDDDDAWDGDELENEGQLALDDDDGQLPWLESADDDEADDGVDTARIVWFALIGVVSLALIVGLIWWLGNRGSDSELVADGSTIEAPSEPFKTRPDDPGGKEFAGTGDTSFKVGDGQEPEARLATDTPPSAAIPGPSPIPGPSIDREQAGSQGSGEAAASGGVAVQVGAYSSRERAQEGWNTLSARHDALKGVKYRIVEGQADIGKVYRLQAVAGSAAGADQLCASLKAQGAACQVKH